MFARRCRYADSVEELAFRLGSGEDFQDLGHDAYLFCLRVLRVVAELKYAWFHRGFVFGPSVDENLSAAFFIFEGDANVGFSHQRFRNTELLNRGDDKPTVGPANFDKNGGICLLFGTAMAQGHSLVVLHG